MRYSAAILTGGNSSRMRGLNKSYLSLNNKRILQSQTNTLLSIFNDVFIVGNENEDKIESLPFYRDSFSSSGPLAGIHAALKHSNADYVFILSCDMPFISSDLIKLMRNSVSQSKPGICVPQHTKGIEPLHAFYRKDLHNVAEKLLQNSNYRIRQMFSYTDVFFYEPPEDYDTHHIFFNINYPEDLLKAHNYAERIKH